jgi:two-component system, chemotaxis family, CheB/CheR fusion protein
MTDASDAVDQRRIPEADRELFARLVVVGSSAGGVDALLTFVATLPGDFAAPIVVAQHLDPRRQSHLGEILSSRSVLPVRTVSGDQPLEPGIVYVIAADRDVEISDYALTVTAPTGTNSSPRPSVDRLLATAARTFGDELVAVILTGTGNDGATGAQAVKAHGGTVIVQNPDTATYPGMPLAVPSSAIDIVADLEAIGPLLGDLISGTYSVPASSDDEDLHAFLDRVRERTGLDFSSYKRATIVRRLQRRMAAAGAATLPDYRRYMERHPEELQRLVASFLIKVTEFFRDPELFTYLRDHVLPGLVSEAREQGELRIWSAGCATGEEAYTLAMLVSDLLGEDAAELPVRIFATDIASDAVEFARRGIYTQAALEGLPPDLIERHFTPVDGAFEVRKQVRSLVVFGEHDLGNRAPFPRIDLVLCRNVLIYFTPELQRRALQLFAFSLRHGGYLALGKAETVSPLPEYFSLEQPRLKIFRRAGAPAPIPVGRVLSMGPLTRPARRQNAPAAATARSLGSSTQPAVREASSSHHAARLLDRLSTGTLTVDRGYHIRSINPSARHLLGIHTTAIGEDLIHRMDPALSGSLRDAIDAALRGEPSTAVYHMPDRVMDDDGRDLLIAVRSLAEENQPANEAVLEVVEITSLARQLRAEVASREQLEVLADRQSSRTDRASAVLRELQAANDVLAIETGRLRSANEELLIANEEAQASAEEVETLNEELQATNEELETLNEELQATVEELTTTNDELQARTIESQNLAAAREADRRRLESILQAAPIGMSVLEGPDHIYRLSNVAALEQLGWSGEDVLGRTAADVQPELVSQGIVALLDQVFTSGQPFVGRDMLIRHDRSRDGRLEDYYYDLVYQPLLNPAGEVEAILAQSIDVTDRLRARHQFEATLSAMSDAVMVVAPDGTLELTNAAFDRSFGPSQTFVPEDELGRQLPEADWPQRRAARGQSFTMLFTLREPEGARRWYEGSGQPLLINGTQQGGVVVIRDVTDRSLRHLQEQFLAVAGHELRTPLTALSLSIDLAARQVERSGDERLRQHIVRAAQQTRRLTELAHEIVDVVRLTTTTLPIERTPLDLSALIRRVLDTIQVIAGEQPVSLQGDDAPLVISGDARRIEQVLLNLLVNAVTFSGGTGPIEISLRQADGVAKVQVRDHGPGIPAHVLPHVFDRFYRVDDERSAREGLGLGLFIARELVNAHEGQIEVESTMGSGATFTVRLPLLATSESPESEPVA